MNEDVAGAGIGSRAGAAAAGTPDGTGTPGENHAAGQDRGSKYCSGTQQNFGQYEVLFLLQNIKVHSSVLDPDLFLYTDPDPAFCLDTDPDPTFHFHTDQDPTIDMDLDPYCFKE